VDELIQQIRLASHAGLHYLALFGALALPDICGALASDDGKATGPKYIAWVQTYVPQQTGKAAEIYGLRCSLLHQGRALPHGGAFPIAFSFPTAISGTLHNLSTMKGDDRVGWISVPRFVDEVTVGAEGWLRQFEHTQTVTRNLEKFARYRPNGLPPHTSGFPVLA
jgi:hypothetical protein